MKGPHLRLLPGTPVSLTPDSGSERGYGHFSLNLKAFPGANSVKFTVRDMIERESTVRMSVP